MPWFPPDALLSSLAGFAHPLAQIAVIAIASPTTSYA